MCNTGFYTTVAVPAIQGLSAANNKVFQGVQVQCQDIVGNFDSTNAKQNTVLFFRLSQDKLSLGCVRIHLHHTVRKVQLQGGAILPDLKTAPVWFTDQVLRPQFIRLAKDKSEDITLFNTAVRSMVARYIESSSKPHTCAACQLRFNGRSSPEQCTQCNLFYHKYKCFPSTQHTCYTRSRTQSCSVADNNVLDLQPRIHHGPVANLQQQSEPGQLQQPVINQQEQVPQRNENKEPHPNGQLRAIAPLQDATYTSISPPGSIAVGVTCTAQQPNIVVTQVTGTPGQSVTVTAAPSLKQAASFDLLPPPHQGPASQIAVNSANAGPSLGAAQTSTGNPPSIDSIPISTNAMQVSYTDQRLIPGEHYTVSTQPPLQAANSYPSFPPPGALWNGAPRLNPNAPVFVSDTPSQNNNSVKRKGTQGKVKKSQVSSDPAGIELEFTKVEVSTLQAALQKQETEIKDLRFRNTILMERNKLLEEEKTKAIHDQYFPSNASHNIPPPSTSSGPTQGAQHNPAGHPVCRHYCCSPCYHCNGHGHTTTNTAVNTDLGEIFSKLSELSKKVNSLEVLLDRLPSIQPNLPTSPSQPIPLSGTSRGVTAVSVATTLPSQEAAPASPPDSSNSSVLSMEEFVFDGDEVNMNLN